MMISRLTLLLCFTITFAVMSHAQVNLSKYNPRIIDPALAQKDTLRYKLPCFDRSPAFLGIAAGYEGGNGNNISMGVAYNVYRTRNKMGGMSGAIVTYNYDLEDQSGGLNAELGYYNLLTFGIGTRFRQDTGLKYQGVKPFIGISLFGAQLTYGLNIMGSNINQLSYEHSFQLRYVLPLLLFKKNYAVYRYFHPPLVHNYGRSGNVYHNEEIRSDIILR